MMALVALQFLPSLKIEDADPKVAPTRSKLFAVGMKSGYQTKRELNDGP
jgi:hypothetical protein